MSQHQRVVLWALPRSGSTVFERSIRELEKVKVLYEPHQNAFYYGPDRLYPHTFYYEDGRPRVEPAATFEATRKKIISLGEECEKGDYQHLFIKDFPYYIAGRYSEYVQEGLAQFKHTFLIRHPLTVGLSWHRAILECPGGWTFEPQELGVKELYTMYETVRSTIDPDPLVIDAEDLFSCPREIMEMYCRTTGLPYAEHMLTWEPKVFAEWKECIYYQVWHGKVMASSGFVKHVPSNSKSSLKDLPSEIQEAVKSALPFYEKLYSVRRVPNGMRTLYVD